MARISADNILFAFGMFAIVMIAYGQSIPTANVQGSLNSMFANWPTLASVTQPIPKCNAWDFVCAANQGIAFSTSFIAVPFLWAGAIVLSFFTRVSAFGNILQFVTFGSTGSLSSIPLGGLFLVALIIVVVIEAFRLFRGAPSGL